MKILKSCRTNTKTSLLCYDKLEMKDYLLKLPPDITGLTRLNLSVRCGDSMQF